MAIACPVDLDTLKLRAEIQSIYARVATEPSGDFHFHRGPVYAAERLGYDANALATLPAIPRRRSPASRIRTALHRFRPARRSSTSGAAPAWICSWRLGR